MQIQVNEYDKQANELLETMGVDFSFSLVGSDCPKFCSDAERSVDMDKLNTFPRKTHIHGKHYRIFLHRRAAFNAQDRSVSFDYWNSYADEEYNALGTKKYRMGESMLRFDGKGKRTISAYDVLSCLQKSDVGTFEDFCGDFGYDSDSRKAESTYRAVLAEWRKIQQFFTPEEIEQLQAVA